MAGLVLFYSPLPSAAFLPFSLRSFVWNTSSVFIGSLCSRCSCPSSLCHADQCKQENDAQVGAASGRVLGEVWCKTSSLLPAAATVRGAGEEFILLMYWREGVSPPVSLLPTVGFPAEGQRLSSPLCYVRMSLHFHCNTHTHTHTHPHTHCQANLSSSYKFN